MDDDIQLPPLPINERFGDTYGSASMLDYGRACYEAGLADRERRAKVEAKPVVHNVVIILKPDGGSWFPMGGDYLPIDGAIAVPLRWANDGRAWIDSERNRELARRLRIVAEVSYTAPNIKRIHDAADALDGGER